MIGSACVVLDAFKQQGRVHVHSEVWSARSQTPMKKGERARVVAINGLILDITAET